MEVMISHLDDQGAQVKHVKHLHVGYGFVLQRSWTAYLKGQKSQRFFGLTVNLCQVCVLIPTDVISSGNQGDMFGRIHSPKHRLLVEVVGAVCSR